MSFNISRHLGYPALGHRGKAFVDIDPMTDNELFIDPSLILTVPTDWCCEAAEIMEDYFDCLYQAYRDRDRRYQDYLLSHAREVNDTRLGYGGGDNGHGNTAEGLMGKFYPLEALTAQIGTISSPSDLTLVIDGFDRDGMSDLLTNILHGQLHKFTMRQMEMNGRRPNATTDFWTWDCCTSEWKHVRSAPAFSVGKGPVLLVPKEIVHHNFLFRPEHFFRHIMLERMCEEQAYVDATGKRKRPTKKELEAAFAQRGEGWLHDSVVEYLKEYPDALWEYNRLRRMFYSNRSLTDDDLDFYVYGKRVA